MLGYSLFAMRAQADRKSLLQSATEKTPGALPPGTLQRTLAIIMGGGAGTRLFPLTKDRAKPAVPLGGKYRIVDISISNCLNSGLRSISEAGLGWLSKQVISAYFVLAARGERT